MKQLLNSDLHAIAPITRHEKCSNIYIIYISLCFVSSACGQKNKNRSRLTHALNKNTPENPKEKNKITNTQQILFFSFLDGGGGVVSVLAHTGVSAILFKKMLSII
jgi:hypothetical protein